MAASWPFGKGGKPAAESHILKGEAPSRLWEYAKEAYHSVGVGQSRKCTLCPNFCELKPGDRSICRSRVNLNGKIYTLCYGNPCSLHVDPIEKKPLFHFLPQSRAFSVACAGCNLRCLNCQNWEISQSKPEDLRTVRLFPADLVASAERSASRSIAYTYSEPVTWFEYMYDSAALARKKGIKNVWITNGYINTRPLEMLCDVMDAANVDLKSFSDETYKTLNAGKLKPVLRTLEVLHKRKVWMEITTLMVPTYADDMNMVRNMCRWIADHIGPDYPLHFSRFHPQYKLKHLPPTPVQVLEEARDTALDCGLHHVYIGNVPRHKGEHTYCPKCGKVLLKRRGYAILKKNMKNGCCNQCGWKVAGVWNSEK